MAVRARRLPGGETAAGWRRWLRWPRARSIRSLLLYGFGVVSLPLIFAVGYAAVTVDRLADQSQNAVYQAAQATRASRALIQQLTSMERRARQYLILDDPDLLDAYRESRDRFRASADRLGRLRVDPGLHRRVTRLVEAEEGVAEGLASGSLSESGVADRFRSLQEMAEGILAGSNQLIDSEVEAMQRQASRAQGVLFWMAAALIPLAVLSSGMFMVLVSRPIRQMDRAIRRLGDTQFDRPVAVSGPRDLEYLGDRLDWLRIQLKEVEDQKTRFLRHVSHELKTPLASLREGVGLLDEGVAGAMSGEQREIVAILDGNIRQLQGLIEDLLDFSNAYLRTPELHLSRFRLDELVATALRHQKPAVMSKSLSLRTRLDEVTVEADAEKLRTVVDNLLSNAVKYSPRGGDLGLTLAGDGDRAVLDVIDDGPGIPGEERGRVFDAFFQGARQAEGYVKGSGLGLAIVREYVRAHGGSVEVLPSGDRPGTDMRVTLPLTAAGGAA